MESTEADRLLCLEIIKMYDNPIVNHHKPPKTTAADIKWEAACDSLQIIIDNLSFITTPCDGHEKFRQPVITEILWKLNELSRNTFTRAHLS